MCRSHAHLNSQKICGPDTYFVTKLGDKLIQPNPIKFTANIMQARHIHNDSDGKGMACEKGIIIVIFTRVLQTHQRSIICGGQKVLCLCNLTLMVQCTTACIQQFMGLSRSTWTPSPSTMEVFGSPLKYLAPYASIQV